MAIYLMRILPVNLCMCICLNIQNNSCLLWGLSEQAKSIFACHFTGEKLLLGTGNQHVAEDRVSQSIAFTPPLTHSPDSGIYQKQLIGHIWCLRQSCQVGSLGKFSVT